MRDKKRDEGYPYNGLEYRRGDRYSYDNYQKEAIYPYRSQYYPKDVAYPYQGGLRGPLNHGRLEFPREVMDNMSQKIASRIGYTGLPRRKGNADECHYCHQQDHIKPECSLFRKHQEKANDYTKKPTVAANVVTPSVCVMTRAQRAATKENSKEESESEDEDKEDEGKNEDSEKSDDQDGGDTIEIMDDDSEDEQKSQEVRNAPDDITWKKNREIHHGESGNAKTPRRKQKELKSQEVRDAPEDLERKKN
jgi:hypothetical protein